DTRNFYANFGTRLAEFLEDLSEKIDAHLIHGDNFQALSLMEAHHRRQIDCVCIDPPYNTGSDGFLYRDNYKDSSWLTQQNQTLQLSRRLLQDTGSLFTCCDENEAHSYAP